LWFFFVHKAKKIDEMRNLRSGGIEAFLTLLDTIKSMSIEELLDSLAPTVSAVPRMVVPVGVAGAGKDMLQDRLLRTFPNRFAKAVSHTTRPMRPNEIEGVSYYFVDADEFARLSKSGAFIEEISTHGNLYGMTHKAIQDVWAQNKSCTAILDYHGLEQFRAQNLEPFAVLIEGPPLDSIRSRMETRGDKPKDIATRLETAERELAYYAEHPNLFNARVRNHDGQQEDAWIEFCRVLGLSA
jgi:guanylate kinase